MIRGATWAVVLLGGTVLGQQDPALRGVFDRYDADRDGAVTRREFPGSDAQYRAMDRNRDGRVTFEEFRASPVARRYLVARNADRREPRIRLGASPRDRLRRLDAVLRLARGKLPRRRWTGAPGAFATLDLDQNGVLDGRDRALAAERAERSGDAARADLPELHAHLPAPERLLERYDENHDQALGRRELHGTKLARAFAFADRNGDGKLDARELGSLVAAVNARVAARNAGDARPRAPVIPFSSWDADKDGRLSVKEWRGNRRLFPRIDVDRDGHVTRRELERYARAIEGETFLERFDLDGDGKVTRDEFGGPEQAFRRADRNRDGIVNGADRRGR